MDKEKVCNTCELIKEIKKYDENCKEEPFATVILKAAIVSEIWKKGIFSGRANYRAKEMKYCPECGHKLKKSETRWKI